MNKTKVSKIFERFAENEPAPTTELAFNSPFELLIAVILSAQATDVSVNKATKLLFPKANTPNAILKLKEEGLKKYIKTIGLYNTKAANIIKTCEILIEKFGSKVPDTREDLESLPGVGRKTANVVLNTAFGHATIAVDTHILRVSNRIGLTKSKTPLGVEQDLIKVIPPVYQKEAHHWLILHGRYICQARKPKCYECFIADLCEYPHKILRNANESV